MTQRLDNGGRRSDPAYYDDEGRVPPPPRSRRRLRKWLIALAVLIGLLVAADFGLAAAAEYQVSKKMREQLQLNEDPEVEIHGFPFILQALRGDYTHVSISAKDVSVSDDLRDLGVYAELYDIRIELSDILAGKVDKATIDNVDGTAKFRSSDISRLLGIPDLEITPAAMRYVLNPEAGDSALDGTNDNPGVADEGDTGVDPLEKNDKTAGVALTGTVAGKKITMYGVISLVGDKVRIMPKKLEFPNDATGSTIAVPEPLQSGLLSRFAITLDPGKLPFSVTPKSVGAEQGAVTLGGHVDDVRFDDASVGGTP